MKEEINRLKESIKEDYRLFIKILLSYYLKCKKQTRKEKAKVR